MKSIHRNVGLVCLVMIGQKKSSTATSQLSHGPHGHVITSTNTILLFGAGQLGCSFRCRQRNSARPTFEEHVPERVTAKWSMRSSGGDPESSLVVLQS